MNNAASICTWKLGFTSMPWHYVENPKCQTYQETACVGPGFHFNQAEATQVTKSPD